MNFVRKKKRGQNGKVKKTWFSEEGYRITWQREVFGVRVPPRFQAAYRCKMPDGRLIWDIVNRKKPLYKTMRAVEEDCERHRKLWEQACQATGIRGLIDLFGKLPIGAPVWVLKKLSRKLAALVLEDKPDKERPELCITPPPIAGETSASRDKPSRNLQKRNPKPSA